MMVVVDHPELLHMDRVHWEEWYRTVGSNLILHPEHWDGRACWFFDSIFFWFEQFIFEDLQNPGASWGNAELDDDSLIVLKYDSRTPHHGASSPSLKAGLSFPSAPREIPLQITNWAKEAPWWQKVGPRFIHSSLQCGWQWSWQPQHYWPWFDFQDTKSDQTVCWHTPMSPPLRIMVSNVSLGPCWGQSLMCHVLCFCSNPDRYLSVNSREHLNCHQSPKLPMLTTHSSNPHNLLSWSFQPLFDTA